MKEFETNGKRIQNFTAESIEEEYKNLLNYYRRMFSNQVIYTIEEEIMGIPEHRINDWVDEMLIDDVRRSGNRIINKIYNSLMDNFHEFLDYINKSPNNNDMMEMYEDKINQIARSIDDSWLEDVVEEFRVSMIRKLTHYCDPFNGITAQNIDKKIDNINYILRQRLRKKAEEFIEEYKEMIKKELRKNVEKIDNILSQIKKDVMTEEEFQEFAQYLKYNNYELIREGEKLYAINIKTKEKIELTYNSKDKILNNVDKKIGFQLTGNQYQSVDIENNKIIIIKSNSFQSCGLDFKYNVAITEKNEGYDFYYNNKKVTSKEEISVIIDKIKTISPLYYQELQKNPIFKEIENEINKYKEEKKEIYINESDGIVKIVQHKREKIKEKFKVFGYELIEKEDGLYAKELKSNKEYKVKYANGYCYFEGFEPSKLNFAPNMTIVTAENIIENNIMFKKEKIRVRTNEELTKFVITINDKIYKLILDEGKIKCNATGKDGEKIELTDEEILSIVSIEFPYLIAYLNNKIEENQKQKGIIENTQEKQTQNQIGEITNNAVKR